jgi:hypothetical protein
MLSLVETSDVLYKYNEKKLLLGGVLIALTLALATSLFSVNNANAAIIKVLQASGCCSGTVTCPNGGPIFGAQISITANREQKTGQTSGSFFVSSHLSGALIGTVSNAQISPNNFRVAGIISQDKVCLGGNQLTPTAFTASGSCGAGVTVQYATASGERGTIPFVNVACS